MHWWLLWSAAVCFSFFSSLGGRVSTLQNTAQASLHPANQPKNRYRDIVACVACVPRLCRACVVFQLQAEGFFFSSQQKQLICDFSPFPSSPFPTFCFVGHANLPPSCVCSYDHTRVRLDASKRQDGSDYINANFVNGYTRSKAYIACQGWVHGVSECVRVVAVACVCTQLSFTLTCCCSR